MSPLALNGHTIVITGASSGVGRAAALAFARRGANVVLLSRQLPVLEALAAECRAAGGQALAVSADVGDTASIARVAAEAIETFGAIDVWINNAGVGAVGDFVQTPMAAHERVIRTNLIGTFNGVHAVLPHFRARGRGVLINTLSLGAFAASPYAAAYSATKFGLRGFSESLRGELRTTPGIRVCDIYPAFLDTPGMQHGANYSGRQLKPMPPLSDPRRVADAMVRLALKPRDSTVVGAATWLTRIAHALAPTLTVKAAGVIMDGYLRHAPPAPPQHGALFEPSARLPSRIDGGWRKPEQRAAISGFALFAVGVVAAYAWRRR